MDPKLIRGRVAKATEARVGALLMLVVVASIFSQCTGASEDKVTVTSSVTDDVGALVDGSKGDTLIRDQVFTEQPGKDISIGNFTSGPRTVIAYTKGHAPTMIGPDPAAISVPPTWTSASDIVSVPFEPEYAIKVVFWIVRGPFKDGADKAKAFIIETNRIWLKERQGLRIDDQHIDVNDPESIINDATGPKNAHGKNVTRFSSNSNPVACSDQIENNLDAIGSVDDAMNVYYVSLVAADVEKLLLGQNLGELCKENVILIAADADPDLLAHELGHSFTLYHVDSDVVVDGDRAKDHFDRKNVMWPARRTVASYLTEGQTLRSIINSGSSVNGLFHKRDDKIMIKANPFCSDSLKAGENHCPPLQLRIWADKGADGKTWSPDLCALGCNQPVMMKAEPKPQAGQPALPQEVLDALQYYLDVKCLVPRAGEAPRKPLIELLGVAKRFKVDALVEQRLVQLVSQGPDKQLLIDLQKETEDEWSDIQDSFKGDPNQSPMVESLKLIKPVTKEAYINARLAQFRQRYRERSAVVLLTMDSQQGKAVIKQEITRDGSLRRVVEATIERLRTLEQPQPGRRDTSR